MMKILLILKMLYKFLKMFCTDKTSQFFLVFIPNIENPIKINDLNFPFSLDYFIQCYLRLKNRKGHEVLNGQDESSIYVYLSFFKLFLNFDFEKKINSNEEFNNNVILHKINFTDEDKNIKDKNNNTQNGKVKKKKVIDSPKRRPGRKYVKINENVDIIPVENWKQYNCDMSEGRQRHTICKCCNIL